MNIGTIEQLWDAAIDFRILHGELRHWATKPKSAASVRVTRHFLKHQRQLGNAAKSGIGFAETQRRRRQIAAKTLQVN